MLLSLGRLFRGPRTRRRSHRPTFRAMSHCEAMESRVLLTTPPTVTTLTLANDTGNPGDNKTNDPTIQGTVDDDDTASLLLLHIDVDGDGLNDQSASTDTNGNFTVDISGTLSNSMTDYGSVTVQVKAYDSVDGWSAWKSLTFTWENQSPTVDDLDLDNDTGPSSTDSITTDGTIGGSIGNDGSIDGLTIEIDVDDDGVYDYSTSTDSSGNWSYDLTGELSFDEHTIKVRVVEYDHFMNEAFSDWEAITYTLDPGVDGFYQESGSTVAGNLAGTTGLANITIEIDTDGDGVSDVSTTTDEYGLFSIDLSSELSSGTHTVYARTPNGDWVSLTFTF